MLTVSLAALRFLLFVPLCDVVLSVKIGHQLPPGERAVARCGLARSRGSRRTNVVKKRGNSSVTYGLDQGLAQVPWHNVAVTPPVNQPVA